MPNKGSASRSIHSFFEAGSCDARAAHVPEVAYKGEECVHKLTSALPEHSGWCSESLFINVYRLKLLECINVEKSKLQGSLSFPQGINDQFAT